MDDDEIRRMLALSDPAMAAPHLRHVADIAREAKRQHEARARRQKTGRWVVPSLVLAGGLVVTTAGIDLQTSFLSRPPFFGTNPGDQRPGEGVRYVPGSGQDMGERCLLFPDYFGLEPDELRDLAEAIDSGSWEEPIAKAASGALESIGIEPLTNEARTDDAFDAEVEAVNAMITTLSVAIVPTIDGEEKVVTAWTVTCREGLW